MAVNLSPYGGVGAQFLDNAGNVLTGGKIETYAAGTTTPQATYTSSNGGTPHSNPIILDASGRVPGGEIWLTDGLSYKFILRDSNDVLIATYDNVTGINSNFIAFTNEQEIQTATAGQTVFNLTTTTYQPGTNSLSVFVDGVNQYGPGAQYAYLETDNDTVTFVTGLHVGAEVKFTTSQLNSSGLQANAFQVSYTPPFTGSVATNVGDKLAETVSVTDFGAVGDGVADDTVAIQAAINYVTTLGGGSVYFPVGEYLAGGLIVDSQYVNLTGASEASIVTVKNSTTGIWIKQHWCNIINLTIQSQGTKNDGLGTNGVLYEKATANSIGYVNNQNLTIKNFSGYGLRITEAINFYLNRIYVVSCTTGITINRSGTGPADFSTTIDFENVYVTSCGTGIFGEYVYRSRFNVIAESCTYGMDMSAGDFTLFRCYFEDNITLGARIVNCGCQNLWSYSNDPTTDAVSITFTGAVAAANRGYVVADDYDMIMKRLALLSGFGVDPLYLAAYGTTSNDGLKYGENTVALVRGTNLFNNAAWLGNNGLTNDFDGWDNLNQGFKIAGTVGGGGTNDPYGMLQTVTLDNTKEYVIDLHTTTVSGSGITTIRVGSDTVTSGVAFTPTANGANVIKCFGADITGTVYEAYVNSFTIAEVLADQTQVAEANDRLTRQKIGRGVNYVSAAPTTGAWLQGEIVYNTAPTSGGYVGWVCTASGKPGTWNTFGLIS
jgi:hypothetical protein